MNPLTRNSEMCLSPKTKTKAIQIHSRIYPTSLAKTIKICLNLKLKSSSGGIPALRTGLWKIIEKFWLTPYNNFWRKLPKFKDYPKITLFQPTSTQTSRLYCLMKICSHLNKLPNTRRGSERKSMNSKSSRKCSKTFQNSKKQSQKTPSCWVSGSSSTLTTLFRESCTKTISA